MIGENKQRTRVKKYRALARPKGFTLLETLLTITAIALLTGIVTFAAITLQKNTRDSARDSQVRIISDALEKYHRKNGEYPSVALMTSSNVDTIKQKLAISDPTILKLPGSTASNSITTSSPSATRMVYAANTTDSTKNTQCQTNVNGYCDSFTLSYVKESGGTATYQSLHKTFTAVKDGSVCDEGDTQNGTTCTHSYPAAYQEATYSCPSGSTLSGTNCISTYAASYSPATSGYWCPSGGTLSGQTCYTSSSYAASQSLGGRFCHMGTLSGDVCLTGGIDFVYGCSIGAPYNGGCLHITSVQSNGTCPPHYTMSGGGCWRTTDQTIVDFSCPSGWSKYSILTCATAAAYSISYSCPYGGSLSGSTCYTSSSYGATSYENPESYDCNGSDVLNNSTNICTKTVAATTVDGYHYCPDGGTVSGTTCSYTYQLEG